MPVDTPVFPPLGAALRQWAVRVMDVILHLGAHRTGTTSFQDYMRRHTDDCAAHAVGFWGPRRTRRGLYAELLPQNQSSEATRRRAETRIRLAIDRAQSKGMGRLIISDENMIGSVRDNIRSGQLYPRIAERMSHIAEAFDGRITAVIFSVRGLDRYQCSSLAYAVSRGHPVPDRAHLHDMATDPRGWREVVCDLAAALPGVPLQVLPFERFVGRPHTVLSIAGGFDAPRDTQRACLNRSPMLPELRRVLSTKGMSPAALPFGMGRWNPFTNEEHAALREKHADDMMWLTAGADGLATLTEDCLRDRAGQTPPPGALEKGRRDEFEERRMARPG